MVRSRAYQSATLLAVLLALVASGLSTLLASWLLKVRAIDAFGGSLALLLSVIGAVMTVSWVRLRLAAPRGSLEGLGSLIFGLGSLLAVVVPGWQLHEGTRKSILTSLGVTSNLVEDDIPRAFILFACCLAAFSVFELSGTREEASTSGVKRLPSRLSWNAREVYYALMIMGSPVTLLLSRGSRSSAFSQRGTAHGQGVIVVLGYCVPLAIALGLTYRHWGSKRLAAVSAVATLAFTVVTGTRTPLILLACAAVPRVVRWLTRRGARPQAYGAALLAMYCGAGLVIGVAQWRHSVTTGEGVGLADSISAGMVNPIGGLAQQGGLDTVDGAVLSLNVKRSDLGVSYFDPTKALTTLVPYQLWPDKPKFLGPEVSHYYTLFGGNAGIFLSGPGYGAIVYGGIPGATALFAILGYATRRVLRARAHGIGTGLFIYFLVRFFFGGDAFDAFHVLNLCIGLGLASVLAYLFNQTRAA